MPIDAYANDPAFRELLRDPAFRERVHGRVLRGHWDRARRSATASKR